MLIRLHPSLQYALCVVYPAGIPLQAEEHLARRGRAVHADTPLAAPTPGPSTITHYGGTSR